MCSLIAKYDEELRKLLQTVNLRKMPQYISLISQTMYLPNSQASGKQYVVETKVLADRMTGMCKWGWPLNFSYRLIETS